MNSRALPFRAQSSADGGAFLSFGFNLESLRALYLPAFGRYGYETLNLRLSLWGLNFPPINRNDKSQVFGSALSSNRQTTVSPIISAYRSSDHEPLFSSQLGFLLRMSFCVSVEFAMIQMSERGGWRTLSFQTMRQFLSRGNELWVPYPSRSRCSSERVRRLNFTVRVHTHPLTASPTQSLLYSPVRSGVPLSPLNAEC